MRPVVFVRGGWLVWYDRRRSEGRPVGGGSFNRRATGSEAENFRAKRGRLWGYVKVPGAHGGFNLARLGAPDVGGFAEGVLVPMFATAPDSGEYLVGWYRNARCFPWLDERSGFYGVFNYEASAEEAVLLPLSHRVFRAPTKQGGGFGQANVRYAYDGRGQSSALPWMRKAIAWIDRYRGPNLLEGGDPGVLPVDRRGGTPGQGLMDDAAARRAVELHAMEAASKYLRARGFQKIADVSASSSWDFLCMKGDVELRVEVKGTTTAGRAVLVTRNEVDAARADGVPTAMFILYGVEVSKRGRKWTARGGTARWLANWKPGNSELRATEYEYTVSPRAGRVRAPRRGW